LSTGRVCCAHLFRLIFLHKGISLPGHTIPRRFIRRSSIEISLADRYVGLALLKEGSVISYSSAISSDPGHFWSKLRCYATRKHVENGDRAKDNSVV
jgi:hypothetical protein